MKKIIVSALVLSFALIGTGCPGRDDAYMRFSWWGNPLRNAQTTEVLNMFSEQTGIDVEELVGTFGEYWGMMSTLAVARNLPDVIQHNLPQMLEHVESGLLVDLRPFIQDGRINTANVPQAVMEQGRVGDGIFAIPMGMNVASIVYNRSLLESLGLSAPRNITLEEFTNIARQVYAQTGVRTNWVSEAPINPMIVHLRAQGVEAFEPAPGGGWRLGGTPENWQNFFDFVNLGIQEGWHFRLEDWGGRDRSALATNPLVYPPDLTANPNLRSWLAFQWSNQIEALQTAIGSDSVLNLTTPPSTDPQRSNFGRASMLLAITRDASNQNAAAQLIDFYTNTQAVHEIILGERGIPINTVIASATAPRLSPGGQINAEFVAWVNQPENSSSFMGLEPEGAGQFRSELILVTDMVMAGSLTPAAAAQRLFAFGNIVIR